MNNELQVYKETSAFGSGDVLWLSNVRQEFIEETGSYIELRTLVEIFEEMGMPEELEASASINYVINMFLVDCCDELKELYSLSDEQHESLIDSIYINAMDSHLDIDVSTDDLFIGVEERDKLNKIVEIF